MHFYVDNVLLMYYTVFMKARNTEMERIREAFEMIENMERLKRAFELVENKEDWKAPITAMVSDADLNDVIEAIRFYTATEPVVTTMFSFPGFSLVTSCGYRLGPAGDH